MAARYDAETLVLEWEERLVARHIECSSPLPGQNHVGPRANHIASTEDGCRPRSYGNGGAVWHRRRHAKMMKVSHGPGE